MTILDQHRLDQLQTRVRGQVHLPTDPGFDRARQPWNRAIEQQPLAGVDAADADDVVEVVRFAGRHRIPVTTQASGHGATGHNNDAILLRTAALDTITVDPDTRTARIGAGVRSGDLQRAVAPHGLTALPGSSPVVTVTGAGLGGGLSWFSRSFGWMSDSIRGLDVVTADGEARHVSADSDAELFWALRGGGGNLAIVTAVELGLHRAPTVVGGRQLWHGRHAREVARAFREMTSTAPDGLTLWFELLQFPGAEPMVAIDSTYLGDEATARGLMSATDQLPAPMADSRAVLSVAELGTITAEPTDPGPGQSRAELLTQLDDAALDALLDEPLDPVLLVQIRHLGGALARPSDSPQGPLTAPYLMYAFGSPSSPEQADAIAQKQSRLAQALPVTGRKPLTFLNPAEDLSAALPSASRRRLREIKAARDPQQLIQGNFGLD